MDYWERRRLADNLDTEPAVLLGLVNDREPDVRECLAENLRLPLEGALALAKDESLIVRDTLGRHRTDPEVLAVLAEDPEMWTALLKNRSSSEDDLRKVMHNVAAQRSSLTWHGALCDLCKHPNCPPEYKDLAREAQEEHERRRQAALATSGRGTGNAVSRSVEAKVKGLDAAARTEQRIKDNT